MDFSQIAIKNKNPNNMEKKKLYIFNNKAGAANSKKTT